MRYVLSAVAAGCVLSACTGPDDVGERPSRAAESPAPSDSTRAPGGTSGSTTCVSRADGYAVEHPVTWQSSHASPREPCRWFSPEPITPVARDDPAAIPIRLLLVPHGLEQVQHLERADADVLSSERLEVNGRSAVRQELRSAGQGLLPAGTRSTQWLVDLGSRTLVASTTELASAGTYVGNTQVLDTMMRSLRRLEQQPVACSAGHLPAEPGVQAGLPEAVQETRRHLYVAAVRCDFERLAALVPAEGFTYSFGGGDDPTGSWRRAELRGDRRPPMLYLAGVLQRPYAERQVQGTTHYSWPSAFAYDTWEDVPPQDRAALEPLYDEDDFADFEQFGGYTGYRVSIAADGTWRVFVAGD